MDVARGCYERKCETVKKCVFLISFQARARARPQANACQTCVHMSGMFGMAFGFRTTRVRAEKRQKGVNESGANVKVPKVNEKNTNAPPLAGGRGASGLAASADRGLFLRLVHDSRA